MKQVSADQQIAMSHFDNVSMYLMHIAVAFLNRTMITIACALDAVIQYNDAITPCYT